MATKQPWFVGDRAEALAVLALTRRRDLEIVRQSKSYWGWGQDLLVRVVGSNMSSDPLFTVEVKGTLRSLSSKRVSFEVKYSPLEFRLRDLPVCVFLFEVRDDRGFYRWLNEPMVTERGAELRFADEFARHEGSLSNGAEVISIESPFSELNDEAFDAIVGRVVQWHEASFPRLVQKAG